MDVSRLFAEYRPNARSAPAADLVVRDATTADVASMARIAQQRNGGEPAAHEAALERALREPANSLILVAVDGGRVAGYGKAGVFTPPDDAPANCAPAGWYLTGVTVEETMRRRGIGMALTRARLDRVAERATTVFYFASAMNRASIDLHARLGFVEVTRDFWFPNTSFTGGVGILCRLDLTASRAET